MQQKQKQANKKQKLENNQKAVPKQWKNESEDEVDEFGGKRGITKQIESNRGLTRSRPKDRKNPRKNLRRKYDNALKKRSTMVRGQNLDRSQPYTGESSSIRSNIVRSTSFRN